MNPLFANIVLDVFLRGGPVMWPILFCLIAALAVAVERSMWWWSLNRRVKFEKLNQAFDAISEGRFDESINLTRDSNDPFLATVQEGLVHAHSSLLGAMQLRAMDEIEKAEKRLWILGTFITLAPLLGLLGTVTGIIKSFNALQAGAAGDPRMLSGGIAEALIATAAGLCVAIPALIAYRYLRGRVESFVVEMEKAAIRLADVVEGAGRERGGQDRPAQDRPLQETTPAPRPIAASGSGGR